MTAVTETPMNFVKTRPGVEAVIMRIGFRTTQVILAAEDGEWLRFVVPSVDDAKQMCDLLKIPSHEGYTDQIRQRMSSYRRSPGDWTKAPYPERYRGSST